MTRPTLLSELPRALAALPADGVLELPPRMLGTVGRTINFAISCAREAKRDMIVVIREDKLLVTDRVNRSRL